LERGIGARLAKQTIEPTFEALARTHETSNSHYVHDDGGTHLARLRGLEGFSGLRSLSINELAEKVFTIQLEE
jgi:hypothetical protein